MVQNGWLDMSFLLDPILLVGCGIIIVWLCTRFLFKKKGKKILPILAILVMAIFWLIPISLYLDIIDMPFIGDAGKGNHFMWNSASELFGVEPWIDTNPPTYTMPFSALNIFAVFMFVVVYPLYLYIGIQIGFVLFGRNERQTGLVGLL
jgi:hypothetical protein